MQWIQLGLRAPAVLGCVPRGKSLKFMLDELDVIGDVEDGRMIKAHQCHLTPRHPGIRACRQIFQLLHPAVDPAKSKRLYDSEKREGNFSDRNHFPFLGYALFIPFPYYGNRPLRNRCDASQFSATNSHWVSCPVDCVTL